MTKERLKGRFVFDTDIGKVRMNNEDRALALVDTKGRIILLVCDGMGGQSHGDIASKIAVDYISDAFLNRKFYDISDSYWLRKVIREANKEIYEQSLTNTSFRGMGTTISAVLIVNKFAMITAQIGDSRIYSFKDNHIKQITEDQSYVAFLYRSGQISKEEMKSHPQKNVITNALGINPLVSVDVRLWPYNGENILVCSDGLYNNVSEEEMFSILQSDDTPNQKVASLISTANANGGSDNIAVTYWEMEK